MVLPLMPVLYPLLSLCTSHLMIGDTPSLGVDATSDALLASSIMIQLPPNYYSVFDLADDDDPYADASADTNSLHDTASSSCLHLDFKQSYGLATSAAQHATHLASVTAIMDRISHLVDPPTPEPMLVGAVGNAFATITELQVLKLHEALLSKDKEAWGAAIEDEFQRFQRLKVFEARTRSAVPPRSKLLTST